MASREADSDSVNVRLADFLRARKEEMINGWLGRVQADPAMATRELSVSQLRDDLPQIFDDLAETLRRYESGDVVSRAERDSEKHGIARWRQGFQLREVLREIMHLRSIFVYHLRIFEELHSDLGTAARLYANSKVHEFLDHLGMEASERFLAAEKQARRAGSGIVQ